MRVAIISSIIIWMVIFAAIIAFNPAKAGDREYTINKTYITENVANITESNGTALAIATSQLNFDWSTQKWQGGIGTGSYSGQDAISIGVGKRFNNVLINGSVGRESDKYGYGFGINMRF